MRLHVSKNHQSIVKTRRKEGFGSGMGYKRTEGGDRTKVGVIFMRKGVDEKEASWFSISARVIPEFDICPDRLEFDQNTDQTLAVSIISEKNIYRFVDAQVNHPAFVVSVSEEGDSAKVTFSSEKWQEGFGSIRVILKTNCEVDPEFHLPIFLKRSGQ